MTQPVQLLAWEPPQAQALAWLPLAVRYKLDAAGLKIGLVEWQALGLDERRGLLSCPGGVAFEVLLVALVPGARRVPRVHGLWCDYLQARTPAHQAPS